ncbi:hypothetical protein F52700_5965 [Fusarium sp. NRRL 52700]|nr:hypothetical protein F52700_5965 [Fusarium sp. NRRL 52700]
MVKPHLTNICSTQTKDEPMLATPTNGLVESQPRFGLRFHPHDGSERPQVLTYYPLCTLDSNMFQGRHFVLLSNATPKIQIHRRELGAVHATRHAEKLSDFIIAAFSEVEQTMAPATAVALKQVALQFWTRSSTKGSISKANLTQMPCYEILTGTNGYKKQLCYEYWFCFAVWLGPGHPFLESIRKDMSHLWGVQFPTDTIIYPKSIPLEAQIDLFYGNPVIAPNQDSIEERAKAIKKSIDESTVDDLSAAIKGHLPDNLNRDSTRMQTLETSLASTNRELLGAKNQVRNLENQLAEAKAFQARASIAQDKTNSDMATLRKETQQLKITQTKDIQTLWATLTQHSASFQQRVAEIEAKVLNGEKRVQNEFVLVRSEVAQSAEKAEKAVETGALVLSVLSTPGGQKRKMDEIS